MCGKGKERRCGKGGSLISKVLPQEGDSIHNTEEILERSRKVFGVGGQGTFPTDPYFHLSLQNRDPGNWERNGGQEERDPSFLFCPLRGTNPREAHRFSSLSPAPLFFFCGGGEGRRTLDGQGGAGRAQPRQTLEERREASVRFCTASGFLGGGARCRLQREGGGGGGNRLAVLQRRR